MPGPGAARQRTQNPDLCPAMSDSRTFTRLLPALLLLALPHLVLAEEEYRCHLENGFASLGTISYDTDATGAVRHSLGGIIICREELDQMRTRGIDIEITASPGTGRRGVPLSSGSPKRFLRRTGTGAPLQYNLYDGRYSDSQILTDGSSVGVFLDGGINRFNMMREGTRVNIFSGSTENSINFVTGGGGPALIIDPGQMLPPGTYTDTVVFTVRESNSGPVLSTLTQTFEAVISAGSCSMELEMSGGFNFGNYDPDDEGPLRHTVGNSIRVMCTRTTGIAYMIEADTGQHSDGTTGGTGIYAYRMKLEGGDSYLRYNLWADVGFEIRLDQPQPIFCTNVGCLTTGIWPIVGQIQSLRKVPAGTYRDRVTFTITVF